MRIDKLLSDSNASLIAKAFDFMEIAERELKALMRLDKKNRQRIWNCFGICMPGILIEYEEGMYRNHIRELVERYVNGKDTRPATRMEVLAMLSKMTLASRLDRDVELLALRLADAVYPGKDLLKDVGQESYPGAVQEKYTEFQRKLIQPERYVKSETAVPAWA